MKFTVKDCSAFSPQPNETGRKWLTSLAAKFRAGDLVVSLSDQQKESEHEEDLVYCDKDGTWWAGRYIGQVSLDGSTLTIMPRMGMPALESMFAEATSAVLTKTPGKPADGKTFIVRLLAFLWVSRLTEVARHGLPVLRSDVTSKGTALRGRLDVAASVRLFAAGSRQVVSVRSERSLDHAVSDVLAAAYLTLRKALACPDQDWMPPRTRELMPSLLAAAGPRPRVPTKAELSRVRFTPMTAGFAPLAELSRQIANRQGLAPNADLAGETHGMLLDVAELWELYVLSVLRKASAPLVVRHGTRDRDASKRLLHSDINPSRTMGTLIPDAILYDGNDVRGILDAKYKRFTESFFSQGPKREDLYQMTAYLARFAPPPRQRSWGMLVYPQDPDRPGLAMAETLGPWSLDGGKKMYFIALPCDVAAAVDKLRDLIRQLCLLSSSRHSDLLHG